MHTKTKRLLSLLLSITLLLTAAPIGWLADVDWKLPDFSRLFSLFSHAAAIVASGEEGNMRWELDSSGLLTVSGEGEMTPFLKPDDDSVPIKKVVLEKGVTGIRSFSFQGWESLTDVQIPNSVTSIGSYAFAGCTSLQSIVLPSGVTNIGVYAFDSCTRLINVKLPQSVTYIGYGAFIGCDSLTGLSIAAGNNKYHSAGNCLIETNSKTLISGCKTSVIPADGSVTCIGSGAFRSCKGLTSLTIPNSITSIESQAFFLCDNLRSVIIGNSVTSIGYGAFINCASLTSVTMPKSIRKIEENAFNECRSLKDVYFAGNESDWNIITIEEGNTSLVSANIRYNSAVPVKNYEVSYNANGGTGAPAAQTKTQGKALTLSGTKPAKSYKLTYNANSGSVSPASKTVSAAFKSWNTKADGSGTSYAPGASYTKDASVTLYAQWTNPKAGDLPTPTRSGYTFAGWYTAASNGTKITKDSVIAKSQTLYAHWTPVKKAVTLGKNDIFAFANADENFHTRSYYISDADMIRLASYVREIYRDDPAEAACVINSIQDLRRKQWNGSCYGMAVAAILDKQNAIGFNENFDPAAKTLHDVGAPVKNPAVESAVNYYFLSQRIPFVRNYGNFTYQKGTAVWKAGLKQLVNAAQSGNPILFCYYFGSYGHAIVIKSAAQTSDGGYNLLAYDNRYPDRDVTVQIDKNFSDCTVDGREHAWMIEYTEDMSGYGLIDIDGPDNRYVPASGSINLPDAGSPGAAPDFSAAAGTELTILSSGTVTVENAEGETLTIKDGSVSGTMDVANQCFLVASTADGDGASPVTLTVANSDGFTFSSTAKDLQVSMQRSGIYGSAAVKNADYVVVSLTEGVYILGKDFSYDLALSVNNEVADMISVSGNARKDVSLKLKGDKVVADGIDSASGTVTVFSDVVKMDDYTYSSGYSSVQISKGASGKSGDVKIMGSSAGNGIYDVEIGTLKLGGDQLPGDVSGDGQVTAEDARLALRAAVGLESYAAGAPEFLAADATKDGAITAEDARLILRAAVGLETLS